MQYNPMVDQWDKEKDLLNKTIPNLLTTPNYDYPRQLTINQSNHPSVLDDSYEHPPNKNIFQEDMINKNDNFAQGNILNEIYCQNRNIEKPYVIDIRQEQLNPDNWDSEKQQYNKRVEIRDLKEIEYCNHKNQNWHLYITSPNIYASFLIIFFYIGGVFTLIAGLIIIIIIAVIIGEGGGDSDCDCGNCDCNCSICDKAVYFCCCNFFKLLYEKDPQKSYSLTYDREYYNSRYNRKIQYNEFQNKKNNNQNIRTPYSIFQDCICCSCCDAQSIGDYKKGCVINKIEVYCTNCNSKLAEEYTGTKFIFPSLCLGVFGFAILGVSIYLLKILNVIH